MPRHARSSAADAAARRYRALHEGLEPVRRAQRVPARPRYYVDLGPAAYVGYWKELDEGNGPEPVLYEHKFERRSAPAFAHDDKGRVHLVGGRYTTTAHGIEDRRPRPRENPFMSRARRNRLGRYVPRMNPTIDTDKGSFVWRAALIGLGAVAFEKGMDVLADQTQWSDRTRSLVKGGVALTSGWLLRKKTPFLSATLVAVAGIELVQLAYREFRVDRAVDAVRTRLRAVLARTPLAPGAMTPATAGLGAGRAGGHPRAMLAGMERRAA